ncbi:hypothetical protein DESC_690032 [Desulfosarcina cetonica]|nr:hypothetical protein DESC_690032 [Desulfosarcina cetonica]
MMTGPLQRLDGGVCGACKSWPACDGNRENRHQRRLYSPKNKPFLQRILRIHEKFAAAGDPGLAFHLGDDSGVGTEGGRLHHLAAKSRAQDALDDDGLIRPDLPPGVMQGQSGAYPGAGGAAVHLALGEDADVAGMGALRVGRADNDRAVKEAEIRLKGVRDRPGGHNGALDRHAPFDQAVEIIRPCTHPQVGGVHEGVEGAAVGDVVAHRPQPRHRHGLISAQYKGRHIVEGHALHPSGLHPCMGRNQPRRCVDAHRGERFDHRYQPRFHGHGGHGDDAVAAHGAVALVMQEKHPEIGVYRHRRGDDAAIHVRVAARLPHEGPADGIMLRDHVASVLKDRGAGKFRQPAGDNPEWLAAGMGIEGGDFSPACRRGPLAQGVEQGHGEGSVSQL